jgi:hypothetical protein
VNTTRIGWKITKPYIKVVGQAAKSASAAAGGGVNLIPDTANMTMVCIGDGIATLQVGPTFYDIAVDDWSDRGGCTGWGVVGTNHTRFYNCSARDCDVGWWFYRQQTTDDCAWHDLHSCTGSHCIRHIIRCGNSYGIKLDGGDFVCHGTGICTDRVNHFFATNTMFDGGLGIFAPPWGGGAGIMFNNLKLENCSTGADLDAFGTQSQGLGYAINGGHATASGSAGTTALLLRSTNVDNPRITNWLIESTWTNGVIDNAVDTLVSASNFSTNRGVSRDSIYNTIKLADETRTANTTLTDDGELKIYVKANTKYRINGFVYFDTVAAADFKYAFTGPASPTLVRMQRAHAVAGAAPTGLATDTALPGSTALTGTGTNGGVVQFVSIFHNGSTAGYFTFQWAQNTSDAGSTIVRAGSYIDYATIG